MRALQIMHHHIILVHNDTWSSGVQDRIARCRIRGRVQAASECESAESGGAHLFWTSGGIHYMFSYFVNHIYIHIHTYMHTYIHTYICICIYACGPCPTGWSRGCRRGGTRFQSTSCMDQPFADTYPHTRADRGA
jgi:hypothetical protein